MVTADRALERYKQHHDRSTVDVTIATVGTVKALMRDPSATVSPQEPLYAPPQHDREARIMRYNLPENLQEADEGTLIEAFHRRRLTFSGRTFLIDGLPKFGYMLGKLGYVDLLLKGQ